MALLYPGLKVKCVRGTGNGVGKTAIVVSTLPETEVHAMLGLTLTVRWDQALILMNIGTGEQRLHPPGTQTAEDPNNFEPIIPEGELHEQEYEIVEELEA